MNCLRPRHGFTFLELLIVAAALVALAAHLDASTNLNERAQEQEFSKPVDLRENQIAGRFWVREFTGLLDEIEINKDHTVRSGSYVEIKTTPQFKQAPPRFRTGQWTLVENLFIVELPIRPDIILTNQSRIITNHFATLITNQFLSFRNTLVMLSPPPGWSITQTFNNHFYYVNEPDYMPRLLTTTVPGEPQIDSLQNPP
ncbi:MAG: hypothetical protein WCS70_11095 [Verrucomicrobiota bacterium]